MTLIITTPTPTGRPLNSKERVGVVLVIEDEIRVYGKSWLNARGVKHNKCLWWHLGLKSGGLVGFGALCVCVMRGKILPPDDFLSQCRY